MHIVYMEHKEANEIRLPEQVGLTENNIIMWLVVYNNYIIYVNAGTLYLYVSHTWGEGGLRSDGNKWTTLAEILLGGC